MHVFAETIVLTLGPPNTDLGNVQARLAAELEQHRAAFFECR